MAELANGCWPIIKCCLGSFVIFQGIWPSIVKKPYNFVIFQGGGGPDPLSPPDPRMMRIKEVCKLIKNDIYNYGGLAFSIKNVEK